MATRRSTRAARPRPATRGPGSYCFVLAPRVGQLWDWLPGAVPNNTACPGTRGRQGGGNLVFMPMFSREGDISLNIQYHAYPKVGTELKTMGLLRLSKGQ